MDHSLGMGKKGIKRLVFQFSVPTFIVLTVNSVFAIFDKIIIGRGIGENGLSAFAASMPMIMISTAFGGMISNGGATLISTRLGRGKRERAEQIMCNAIMLTAIVSVAISVLSIVFIDSILNVLMRGDKLREQAIGFLIISICGSIFRNISMCTNDYIRAEGNPKYPAIIGIAAASISLILNYVLVCLCKFGIEATAVAALIGEIICFAAGIIYFLSGKSVLRIRVKDFRLKLKVIKNIFMIGSPFFISRILGSITSIFMNRQLAFYAGNRGVAAISIIGSICFLLGMPIVSISQGVEPILGYNYGSKQYGRVKKTLLLGFIVSSAIATIVYLASAKQLRLLIALFTNSKSGLNAFTYDGLSIILLTMPLMGIQMIGSNYFQSTGKYKQSFVLTLSRSVVVLSFLSILPKYLGLKGIWFSLVVEDLAYFILVCFMLCIDIKKLKKMKS